jgi:DNA-3-methyladenine glycosylase II
MKTAALRHLAIADPVLGGLIDRVGPCTLEPDRARTPFQALVRAVAYQQLNGRAAETILNRFLALFPRGRFPSAPAILNLEADALTGVGFSRAKAGYVREIARMTLEGVVPGRGQIQRLSDEDVVARLTQIKGVGRWTVEMLLIFSLGRPDVLPAADYGIRQGFALAFKKRRLPEPEEILRRGERWRPYRTTASWYLWRAVDPEA